MPENPIQPTRPPRPENNLKPARPSKADELASTRQCRIGLDVVLARLKESRMTTHRNLAAQKLAQAILHLQSDERTWTEPGAAVEGAES